MAESKRTPERAEAICALLRTGTTHRAAANACGISHTTFYEWIAEDPDFSDMVKSAEAEVENEMAALVQTAARDTWQAAAWWLERRRNTDYAKREKQDLDGGLRIEIVDKTNADSSSSS